MAGSKKAKKRKSTSRNYSRRDFLAGGGAAIAACAPVTAAVTATAAPVSPAKTAYAASKGYLVYDSKKCAACTTCMLTCSLVHEGNQNLSLSRIQIAQDSFGKFPNDIKMAVCRQCVTPACVENCPTGACFVDNANGNIRRIDSQKCIGCKTCLSTCPQQPNRTVWNPTTRKSFKCDLCVDAPNWSERGGPDGKQACVELCPMMALKFVKETPDQVETDGYDVNLRNQNWVNLGVVDSMEIVPPMYATATAQPPQAKPAAKPKE